MFRTALIVLMAIIGLAPMASAEIVTYVLQTPGVV
jgi:hypothetical protein